MKTRLPLSLLLLALLACVAFSQSVTITPKKTIYRRPKPLSSYKKTFTIRYPRVSGLTPVLNKKVQSAISYERVSNLNLKEELGEIQWLEEADYKVNYNKNGILDITLNMEGSGAYPSDFNKTVVIDLKTGNRVMPQDVFANLSGLAAMCKKAQRDEIKKSLIEIKKESPDEEDPESLFREADFKVENLKEFTISDLGIAFLYDYGFPHVLVALQPEGRYLFNWRQLRPYIKSGGLLHQFVR
jgi:hypothetical protein